MLGFENLQIGEFQNFKHREIFNIPRVNLSDRNLEPGT